MYVLLTWGVALVPMRHLEHRNATPFSKIMTPLFGKKCYICATETKSLKIKRLMNMRTKLYMIALAAISMMLGSCSDSNSDFSQDYLADTPIKLNVSVDEPTTRAGYSDDLKPDAFWLWVYHDDNNNDKYNYDILAEKVGDTWKTYDLNAYFTYQTKNEVTMLWANMTDPVTVNAMVNNNQIEIESVDFPTDQSDVEQLKKADILYMPITQVTPNKAGINVEFQHITSKINLTIELGSEYEFTDKIDQKITDVKIGGTIAQLSFDYDDKGNYIIKPFSHGKVKSITPLCTGTTPYSKTTGVITKASATYEAILIPQTIASGKFTVSFKVDGKLYEWAYDKELTLAPNTAYTLKLIAGDDKVQPVSFSVSAWNPGNGENGEKKETD